MNTKHTLKYAEEPSLDDLFVVKKFNEWMIELRDEPVPKMLFGSLWREGEIAVLSADPGAGKSLLAVQIAESIASGKAFAPFEMTAKPQEVLYLNLKLTPTQFKMRYAAEHDAEDGDTLKNLCQFSKKLYRVDINIHAKLPDGYKTFDEVLPVLVERLVAKRKAKVVVIDNITYLQRSVYGYRETYTMMKALHALRSRLGISILVLARTSKYGSVRESAAGSCSALFSRFADSVFMIGKSRLDPSARFIKQLIVHSSQMIYNSEHVASFILTRAGGNFLQFRHYGFCPESEHKSPVSDDRLWPKIDKVKTLSDEGKSIREIAVALDIPKSNVHRYLQMWTPEIEASMKRQTPDREPYDPTKDPHYFPGREEYDEAKRDPKFKQLTNPSIPDEDPRYRLLMREYGIIDNACYRASQVYKNTGITPKLCEDKQYAEFRRSVGSLAHTEGEARTINSDDKNFCVPSDASQAGSLRSDAKPPTGIPDGCKHAITDHGKDIWIEIEGENGGKPILWWSFDSKGRRQKHERNANGIGITRDKDPDKME